MAGFLSASFAVHSSAQGEPKLPEGLGEETEETEEEKKPDVAPGQPFFVPTGFWEARLGLRTQNDPHEKQESLGETRLQLEFEKFLAATTFALTTDLLYDPVLDDHEIRLEEGQGFVDLREGSLVLRPSRFIDLKVGRQILTWGTGDLIFINDLFPKDWNAFFIGRDPEYLKAPSDALKAGFFSRIANLEIVYTPRFDADRFIDGKRISYWNSVLGRLAGRDAVVQTDKPDDWLEDDEIALRASKNIKGYELALYAYRGFWKSPGGMDPMTGKALFPELLVYGASVRGTVGKGIGNAEIGYYDSGDDADGNNPFLRNGELRLLLGYEQEAAKDFTVGGQYYLERMLDYDAFRRTLLPGTPVADENRHVLTVRLTKLLMRQDLELSLFTFYSPSDADAYLRPRIHYTINDFWSGEIGGNIFLGRDDHTFFAQFEKNSNVYTGLRLNF